MSPKLTRRVVLLAAAFACATCNKESPLTPTTPVVAPARVDLGVLGSAPALLQPGQTLQLFAMAADAGGALTDITNLANWATDSPGVATVATGGIVSGTGAGTANVTATYRSVTGTLQTSVVLTICASAPLSPTALVFNAMAPVSCSDDNGWYGRQVKVTPSQASCTWTAQSDAPWLLMDCMSKKQTYTPKAGDKLSLYYGPQPNNTPVDRIGHITVTFNDGSRLVHTVTVQAPQCSYMLASTEANVPKEGGSGSIDLTVTPSTCQWSISAGPFLNVGSFSMLSGTGSRRIDFQLSPSTLTSARTYTVQFGDDNDLNPKVTFLIKQPPK